MTAPAGRAAPELLVLAGLRRVNRAVGLGAGVALLAAAGLVLADIGLRRVGASLGGTDEVAGYVMAVASAWAMAYALTERAHVRIDIARARLRGAARTALDLAAILAVAGVAVAVAWRGWPLVERSWAMGSRANTPLETPLVLPQALWLAGWAWFALAACVLASCALTLAARGEGAAAEPHLGTEGELEALR